MGLWIKGRLLNIDYRLFLVPFIQIGLLCVIHIIYRMSFKIPFYINMRGAEFPEDLRTNESGFMEFTSCLITIGIIMVMPIIFFSLL